MMELAGHTLFAAMLALAIEVATSSLTKEAYMRVIFGADVTIGGYTRVLDNVERPACSMTCLATPGCHSLGYQAATATCWLYHHLVEFSTVGVSAPGTQYSWLLSPRCPAELGFTLEQGFCYRYINESLDWTSARDTCRGLGGTLFIADTPAKLNFLMSKITAWTWTGASDLDVEGSWRWFDGGLLPLGPVFWNARQPDNARGKQNVAIIELNGKLNDDYISAVHHVACQIHML